MQVVHTVIREQYHVRVLTAHVTAAVNIQQADVLQVAANVTHFKHPVVMIAKAVTINPPVPAVLTAHVTVAASRHRKWKNAGIVQLFAALERERQHTAVNNATLLVNQNTYPLIMVQLATTAIAEIQVPAVQVPEAYQIAGIITIVLKLVVQHANQVIQE